MDFYVIPTLRNIELHHLGDRYFCLAHFYLQDKSYRNFFLAIKQKFPFAWITLDNSAAEKSLVTEDILLSIVEELNPNEVISPDVLFDGETTLENLFSFSKKMKAFPNTEIFACPQGGSKEEWLFCYKEMLSNADVSTIGLSKIAVPFAFKGLDGDKEIAESRQIAVDYLAAHNLVTKPLHFLGMGDPREYSYYRKFDPIIRQYFRSSDSCYTVLSGVNNVSFMRDDFRRIPTYDEFYNYRLSQEEISLVIENVAFLKQYNKGV